MANNKKVKTLGSEYLVKVNNELVQSFHSETGDTKAMLAEARRFVAGLSINDSMELVTITRRTMAETLIASYTPKVKKVLTVDETFSIEGDLNE